MTITMTERVYRDHIIEFGAYETNKPGDWFGTYRVHKDGKKIFGADVVNPADTSAAAEDNAIEKAQNHVDGLLGAA